MVIKPMKDQCSVLRSTLIVLGGMSDWQTLLHLEMSLKMCLLVDL